jgi:hypothetical protein
LLFDPADKKPLVYPRERFLHGNASSSLRRASRRAGHGSPKPGRPMFAADYAQSASKQQTSRPAKLADKYAIDALRELQY